MYVRVNIFMTFQLVINACIIFTDLKREREREREREISCAMRMQCNARAWYEDNQIPLIPV
jgi:hypothetical protein